ncbi:MAG: tail fiber domain-containing protein, partial [Bacteroidia bacterium]|nr:tail fiber domain-containing protein [Bacteroidia bacterium]
STSSRPNLNSWTLYNMNEYGGVESGLSIWEYYDVDNNGSYCNPGDICQSRFHIQNVTGNVGIGKVTPTQKLDVYGSVLSQTSTAQSALLSSDGNLELQRDITSPVPSVGGYVDLKTNFLEDFRTRLYYNNFNGSFNIATTTDGFSTTGSERLTILASNGFTGLGILNPTEKLHVIGNILASGVITPSDARYKQNIVTLNNSLNNVLKLRGVTYDMKAEYKDKGFGTGTQIGVIAQELEAVYPQLINTSSDGYKSVDYSKFAPILIEAIKDLNTKHDNDIQQLNAKHTEQLNTLLKRIEALEKK